MKLSGKAKTAAPLPSFSGTLKELRSERGKKWDLGSTVRKMTVSVEEAEVSAF